MLVDNRYLRCVGGVVEIQRFDYTDQPLQIWCIRFSVIDMEDVLILPTSTQKAHRAPSRSETNQPAFLHVGVEGGVNFKDARNETPNMPRVEAPGRHFRQFGYQKDPACASRVKKPPTHREYVLRSVSQVAMTPRHDIQFGYLPCFLAGVSDVRKSTVLRIAEIEEFDTGARLSAHVFFICETNRMNEEMAVCVDKGHIRMLLPTAEKRMANG